MPVLEIARCYHCDAEIPPRQSGRAGRPRRFCSDRCRKAAYRERRQRLALEPFPIDLELPELPSSLPPDELVARTILDARSAAATFARLSQVARRTFAWRCEVVADEIARTLDRHFPGV